MNFSSVNFVIFLLQYSAVSDCGRTTCQHCFVSVHRVKV